MKMIHTRMVKDSSMVAGFCIVGLYVEFVFCNVGIA